MRNLFSLTSLPFLQFLVFLIGFKILFNCPHCFFIYFFANFFLFCLVPLFLSLLFKIVYQYCFSFNCFSLCLFFYVSCYKLVHPEYSLLFVKRGELSGFYMLDTSRANSESVRRMQLLEQGITKPLNQVCRYHTRHAVSLYAVCSTQSQSQCV